MNGNGKHPTRHLVPTTILLVLSLLLAAAQHSLNLCQLADHRSVPNATVSQPACADHASPTPPDQPRDKQSPSCCSPLAALAALPSLKGSISATVTSIPLHPWHAVTAASAGMAVYQGLARARIGKRADDRGRSPFPRLRSHLALRTILV